MTEAEFISLIDCSFPYDKVIAWKRLTSLAPRISSNAAFMVVHEACRVPSSRKMNRKKAEAILGHLFLRFRHPAIRIVRPALEAHLSGRLLRPQKAAALMRKVAVYRHEYNALALCYFSAADTTRRDLERTYQTVIEHWRSHAAPLHEA